MRVTRLLAVALCAALVCAALGDALSLKSGDALDETDAPRRCIHDEIVQAINVSIDQMPRATIVPSPFGVSRIADNKTLHSAAVQADEWQPIRIGVFTEDIDGAPRYCTAAGQSVPDMLGNIVDCNRADVLTTAGRRTLLQTLLPQAIQLHQKRLNVKPVTGALIVPKLTGNICSHFTVPEAHHSSGVSGFDFVVYAAANPTPTGVVAWATTCASKADGTPLVGVINISPRYIENDETTIRVVAHELLHALGYSVNFFNQQKMVTSVSVRDKPASLVMNTPNVVAKAREHYGCDTLTYMELEDEGGSGTANSHWKRRNAKDEMMAGVENVGYYTALTIAAMEDTGFYKGNYANADPMPWGYQAGCGLLDNKCVVNGVSQYPDMFCTTLRREEYCTSDHRAIGTCDIGQFYMHLPSYYQYFYSSSRGGATPLMDFCPVVKPYKNTACTNGDTNVMPGSVVGPNARCLPLTGPITQFGLTAVHGICAHVHCDLSSSTYRVKILDANEYTDCPEGKRYSLYSLSSTFVSGFFICPSYAAMCGPVAPPASDAAKIAKIAHPVSVLLMSFALLLLFA